MQRLRIAILIEAWLVETWVWESIQAVVDHQDFAFTVVVTSKSKSVSAPLLYRLFCWFDERRIRRYKLNGGNARVDVQAQLSASKVSTLVAADSLIANLAALAPDIVINFTAHTIPVANIRYGVWRYLPEALARDVFWNVYLRRPVSELQLVAGGGRDAVYCSLGRTEVRTHGSSPTFTLFELRHSALLLICQALEKLARHTPAPGDFWASLPLCHTAASPKDRAPGAGPVVALLLRYLRILIQSRRSRTEPTQWTVGLTEATITDFMEKDRPGDVVWQLTDASHYYADPFLLRHGSKRYLFVEDYVYAKRLGHIAVMEVGEDLTLSEPQAVLVKDFHMSLPSIFWHEGQAYLLVEQEQSNRIMLYRGTEFPLRWVESHALVENFRGVDNMLLWRDDMWWLFTSDCRYGNQDNHLSLFMSEDLLKPFRPHPKNPINTGLQGSRMAGAFITLPDGRLLRPAQNCVQQYGHSLILKEVLTLTPENYAESFVNEVTLATAGSPLRALHTLALEGDLAAIDSFCPSK